MMPEQCRIDLHNFLISDHLSDIASKMSLSFSGQSISCYCEPSFYPSHLDNCLCVRACVRACVCVSLCVFA